MEVEYKVQLTYLSLVPQQNGHTLPKYRSRISTYRCTISNVINSLSSDSIPVMKNNEAYLNQQKNHKQ